MQILDGIAHAMLDNDTLHLAGPAGDLRDADERWLVALGAPLAAFNGDWLDSVRSRRDEGVLRSGTAKVWGVSDRASFESRAASLRDEGQRAAFGAVWRSILAMDVAARSMPGWLRGIIDAVAPQFHEAKLDARDGTRAVMAESGLSMKEVIETRQTARDWLPEIRAKLGVDPARVQSLVAWDSVRLANLARWAVTLGYVERDAFAAFAGGLAAEVRAAYGSWAEVSAAYVAGGLIWNHTRAREEELLRTNALLVADPRSPYRTVPFR